MGDTRTRQKTSETPTLEEIKTWPATVGAPRGGSAFGLAPSTTYEAIKSGKFPARTILIGGRVRVVTASIVAVLSEGDAA